MGQSFLENFFLTCFRKNFAKDQKTFYLVYNEKYYRAFLYKQSNEPNEKKQKYSNKKCRLFYLFFIFIF